MSLHGGPAPTVRAATPDDAPAIWAILEPTIRAGETYPLPRDMSEADALAYWFDARHEIFVAKDAGRVVGTYYIRANQTGAGDHVCNCGYMTAPDATGRGVARAMCAHSLAHARRRGFRAMQFNLVVSTNERAFRLWQAMGFAVVGPLTGAFRHPTRGDVDAFVMYQTL